MSKGGDNQLKCGDYFLFIKMRAGDNDQEIGLTTNMKF